ncbi:MAG: hypothetical protein J6S57_00485 [Alphaproteobacteria bacterium]|nr:hypothetical protein [Alphaproteobacteria bacterium]
MMKYVKNPGPFTTKQFSIYETTQEIMDVVAIAQDCIKNGDLKLAQRNLNKVEHYVKHIQEKVKIALHYVPTDVQEKEFL